MTTYTSQEVELVLHSRKELWANADGLLSEMDVDPINMLHAFAALLRAREEAKPTGWYVRLWHGDFLQYGYHPPNDDIGWKPFFDHPPTDSAEVTEKQISAFSHGWFSIIGKQGIDHTSFNDRVKAGLAAMSAESREESHE